MSHELLPDPDRWLQRRLSPYQYGQAVWAYVEGRWGDDIVRRVFKTALKSGLEQAFSSVLEMEQQELFNTFHETLRT